MTDDILVEERGPVLALPFNRPQQRNAMTFAMYDALMAACERVDKSDRIKVMTLRRLHAGGTKVDVSDVFARVYGSADLAAGAAAPATATPSGVAHDDRSRG